VVNLIRHAIGRPLIKLGNAALKNIPTPVRVYYVGLPWEERPVSLRDRLSFACFHKRKALSIADLTNAAFVATVAGLMLWQSVAEHKAIHAMVWFGEGAPSDTRQLSAPLEQAVAGIALPSERRFPAANPHTGLSQATQTPTLLTLMVKRDSGQTFLFARHYDRISEQLRKPFGNPPPAPLAPVRNKLASSQQAMFEEVFAWTTRPGTPDVSVRIP
jgi:hypothetical protein